MAFITDWRDVIPISHLIVDILSTFADNLPLNLPLPPGMDVKEDTTIPFPDIPHSPVVLEHINRPLTLQERKQLFVKAEDWNIEWEPFKSRAVRFDNLYIRVSFCMSFLGKNKDITGMGLTSFSS